MRKILQILLLLPLFVGFTACGGDEEPNGPDINNVNASADKTFAKLTGSYSATWSESLNDVVYDMTFTPYVAPQNKDIRVSNGGNVNFTKRVRVFGRVNVIQTYVFSSGYTHEQSNKNYLYGIESTVGEPYEIVFFPYTTDNEDFIYGLSSSYYIKSITPNSFDLSMEGKNGIYHQFAK